MNGRRDFAAVLVLLLVGGSVAAFPAAADSGSASTPTSRTAGMPPSGTSWWWNSKPYPYLVAVRRHGDRIKWAEAGPMTSPCFTGHLVRPNVYRGGGQSQNGYYSPQERKIWVSGGVLHVRTAYIPEEHVWDQPTYSVRHRVYASSARRWLRQQEIPMRVFWDCA